MSTLERYELSAIAAAREAGGVLRDRFRELGPLDVERKGVHDFVTEVDREAERVVIGRLGSEHPEVAIQAEEGSPGADRSDLRFIVDPLDGTTNFIHGIPTFAVSIALHDADGLAVGVVYDPIHDELFHARRGAGARCNGATLKASRETDLHRALVATGFPFREFDKLDGYVEALRAFMTGTAGIRRAGSAALDLVHTAVGRYDGFFEVGLAPWDLAAGALIVAEAGGTVTDCGGGGRFLERGEIVAAGAGLHAVMVAITRPHLD